ncbi:hypothetical protein HELRODRAFT_164016 [Helobdella robusta]|uniref:Uncharacterized protein n=1 Tax=Helobdella robusta TaxID=6412 RepID=T1EUR8_HELRO|nr:hypothetical protein HELRODRAFT_164016 [Helobdella robusta]ESN94217.1 hypothetical protein HELRODRAFT_164016 [Helobdella robusta]
MTPGHNLFLGLIQKLKIFSVFDAFMGVRRRQLHAVRLSHAIYLRFLEDNHFKTSLRLPLGVGHEGILHVIHASHVRNLSSTNINVILPESIQPPRNEQQPIFTTPLSRQTSSILIESNKEKAKNIRNAKLLDLGEVLKTMRISFVTFNNDTDCKYSYICKKNQKLLTVPWWIVKSSLSASLLKSFAHMEATTNRA